MIHCSDTIAIQIYIITINFSLLYKNKAFKEEGEWRLIYNPLEENNCDKNKRTYLIKNNTIEPKFELSVKFDESAIELNSERPFDLNLPIHRILLGPSHASPLAFEATKNMLRKLGKEHLIKKLYASEIPYRTKPGG